MWLKYLHTYFMVSGYSSNYNFSKAHAYYIYTFMQTGKYKNIATNGVRGCGESSK